MKALQPFLATLLAAGFAFGGGWLAARHWGPKAPLPESRREGASARRVEEPAEGAQSASTAEALAQKEVEAREAMIAHLQKGSLPVDRQQFSEWARTVPLAELEAVIAALGPSPEPTWELRDLVARLAARDPRAVLRRFEEWTAFTRFQFIGTVVAGWATEDPKAALAWLATQPTNAATDKAREAALTHMATADPQAALATLRENGWLWDSPRAMQGIFRVWVKNDPKTALEQWRSLNRELNPPLSPGAEPPMAPRTMGLIASALGQAAESKKVEAVEAAIALMEPREFAKMDANMWHRMVVRQNPLAFLPLLEARLDKKTMSNLVEITLYSALPEQREAVAAALKHPELKTAAQPSVASPQTELPATRNVIQEPSGRPTAGEGFWDTPIKLD